MQLLKFIVPVEYDGVLVKSFLRGFCGVSSRLMVKLKKEEKGITANGKQIRTIDRLCAGDVVILSFPEDNNQIQAQHTAVSVLYEDEHIILFDKPAGMPVHPSAGYADGTLANAARAYALSKGENWLFRPVYRLDKDTSGLVLVAKNAYSAAKLAHGVKKQYLAVCEGILTGSGTINAPIRVKQGHTIQREVGEDGVPAVTHWQVLSAQQGHTLLSVHLETGRTHQIRVHFSSLGMPLAGDDFYGGHRTFIQRQALHCAAVQLIHPVSGKYLEMKSVLPKDFFNIYACSVYFCSHMG